MITELDFMTQQLEGGIHQIRWQRLIEDGVHIRMGKIIQ